MRIAIAAPVLAGALVLGALAVPSAAFAATAKPVITKASGSSLTVGLSGTYKLTLAVSAKDASGIKSIKVLPLPVALLKAYGPITAADVADGGEALKIHSATATTATASETATEKAVRGDMPLNEEAGAWQLAVLVTAKDGSTTFNAKAATFALKRADRLTAKVSATKVRKGANLTVRGQLNRANWDTFAYQGYGAQQVRLEFRKTGGKTWTTVKWVKSGRTGALSTTVKDSAGGSWRYVYGGNGTSGAAASAQTWVGLK
ncbi:DUF5707 domain-containing protein [Streptacidiphilus sp. PAMC 29251]